MTFLVSLLLLALMVGIGLPLWILTWAALLRFCSSLVGGPVPGWGLAAGVVVIGALVQSFCMGLLGGLDGGMLGALVGFAAWSGTHAVLTGTSWGRAAVIGVLMAFCYWLVSALMLLLGLMTIFGALFAAAL